MNPASSCHIGVHAREAWLSILLFAALCPLTMPAQLVSSGFSVSNPDWEILVTHYGYADLALDRRPGFVGREFLSGEWAAAVFYAGGSNPTQPIWLQPQWFFPDWVSNSNFGVETNFVPIGVNGNGFTLYRSVITNADVRVAMTYEMLDTTNGIAQGTTRKSAGGPGSSLPSNRYVFRQTYRITNISGGTLSNLKLYQFLHGLEMGTTLYDDRMYTGPMNDYRYDNTQQGQSHSFDTRTKETVLHGDTIAFHCRMMPSAWEVGYYGKKGVDSHVVGKPGVGVHLSVEANSLSGLDFFEPAETRWVSGAQCYDLGTLASGASVTNDVLLTVQTTNTVAFPPFNIVTRGLRLTTTNAFIYDFQDTTGNPVIAYILRKSTNVNLTPISAWEQVAIPYFINVPQAGWRRFIIPVAQGDHRSFYIIQPTIQN